jgi:hypothetical protein
MRNPINVPPRMDAVIDYDEAAGFLKKSPLPGALAKFHQHSCPPEAHCAGACTTIS